MLRCRNINLNTTGKISCILLLLVAFFAVNPAVANEDIYADEPSAATNNTSSVTLGLDTDYSNATVTPVGENDNVASITTKATVAVTRTKNYAVYVSSNSSRLSTDYGNYLESIVGSVTGADNIEVNHWGYSFAEGEEASETYKAITTSTSNGASDSTSSTTADYKSTSELNGDEERIFTIKFATKVNGDIVAGEYKGDVVVSVVASPIVLQSLSIAFDTTQVEKVDIKTGSSSGTTIATVTTNGGSTGELLEIGGTYYLVPTFRSGYEFSSWSKTGAVGTLGSATTANTSYTVGEGVNGLTLTGRASNVCPNGASTFTDSRDGQTYAIRTLADGRCWMLENLRLGAVNLRVSQLNSTNTHITNGSTIAASTFNSTWQKTSGSATYTSPEYINQSGSDAYGSYGTLYNYCAATAGTMCKSSYNSKTDATSDLCPAGWRLPTGGSSGEFQALYDAEGSFDNFRSHFQLPLSGYFGSSTPADQGSDGFRWSSTWRSSNFMYITSIYRTFASANGYQDRSQGFSIRCVLDS